MRQCEVCGKSSQKTVKYKKVRSKWNPVNTRRQKANIQPVKLGDGQKIKACVRCIRTISKKEVI